MPARLCHGVHQGMGHNRSQDNGLGLILSSLCEWRRPRLPWCGQRRVLWGAQQLLKCGSGSSESCHFHTAHGLFQRLPSSFIF